MRTLLLLLFTTALAVTGWGQNEIFDGRLINHTDGDAFLYLSAYIESTDTPSKYKVVTTNTMNLPENHETRGRVFYVTLVSLSGGDIRFKFDTPEGSISTYSRRIFYRSDENIVTSGERGFVLTKRVVPKGFSSIEMMKEAIALFYVAQFTSLETRFKEFDDHWGWRTQDAPRGLRQIGNCMNASGFGIKRN